MKWKVTLLIVLFAILLSGCWDERLLKDTRVVYLSGFDVSEKEEGYRITALVRDLNIGQSSRGETSVTNILTTASGTNLREASLNLDRNIAGTFDPAKGRTIIIGNELAKQGLSQPFNSIFREPRVDLNAKVAITDGTANELMTHLAENEMEKAEFFYDLIDSAEKFTETPPLTLRTFFTYLLDKGRDFALPYVTIDEETNMAKLGGSGLFHKEKFTGEFISNQETTVLLLFLERLGNQANLTSMTETDNGAIISYDVKKAKRDIKVEKRDKVTVTLSLDLLADIVDFPKGDRNEEVSIDKLNEQLGEDLTEQAKAVFKKLAENQSDVLGIGRELMAYYPEIWEELDEDTYYEEIQLIPEIDFTITGEGVIL